MTTVQLEIATDLTADGVGNLLSKIERLLQEGEPRFLRVTAKDVRDPRELTMARDCNGIESPWTQEELDHMIENLESTGRYDVQGRRW